MKQSFRDILINENIILQGPSGLDIKLPSEVKVLLLDGILRENNAKQNSTLKEKLIAYADLSLSLVGKLWAIQQILPLTENKSHKGDVINRLLNIENGESSFTPIELYYATKEIQEIIDKKTIQPNSRALWSSVEFLKEEEMSMECFTAILEHCGNPDSGCSGGNACNDSDMLYLSRQGGFKRSVGICRVLQNFKPKDTSGI